MNNKKLLSNIELNAEVYKQVYNEDIEITYIAEELEENNTPINHKHDNLKDALIKAFSLHLNDKLHGISVEVKQNNNIVVENYSDALTYMLSPNTNKIEQLENKIKELEYLNKYNVLDDFKKSLKE